MGAEVLSSRAIIGMFYNELEQDEGKSWVPELSMYFESDQESETYPWLGMSPAMRQWIGGRNAKGLKDNKIIIINEEYEATLAILKKHLRRDKTGQIRVRIAELAQRANTHWMKLLSELMLVANATVCYDGQFFFDTDHSEGDSGTQDNDLSIDISALDCSVHGSTTDPSVEEIAICILRTIQKILGYKDNQGEPMNELASKFIVKVAPSLLGKATSAVANQFYASGTSNIIKPTGFDVRVVPNVRLATQTTSFQTYRTDGKTKPFIRQEEEGIEMAVIAEGSELEFNEKMHHYGISASRAVGLGYWQHGCMVTMT